MDLCLFDTGGRHEIRRLRLDGPTDGVFHLRVHGVRPGQRYGYRVHGPYQPEQGHRFNASKLLIDPYARLLHGQIGWDGSIQGCSSDGLPDLRDDAHAVPKCVVVSPTEPGSISGWSGRAWKETVIYEAHVKGLTKTHPGLPEEIRGTFDALGSQPIIEHLARLGITSLELMPVHAFSRDQFLIRKGLGNYWGYSTLSYFAPHQQYVGPTGAAGLRRAIAALHDAGIEVILDVVYNHSCELDEFGPTLSFRGIDNASYYRLRRTDRGVYVNDTGCGNTLNFAHSRVAALVVASLRHWVQNYGVDGFRFDLATTLGREPDAYSDQAALFGMIRADPVLAAVKLIAEPWDLGENGYRLGQFPLGWSEWNDRFRDAVRAFWRGDRGSLPGFTQALTGSREIFEASGRGPHSSINYVACHDGFTLDDLVSFKGKHNQANLEGNHDGHDANLSQNFGIEGLTEEATILDLRARTKCNLLATLFCAHGTPMIGMGDELSRSQRGNNNAYCQDNEVSWVDWSSPLHADAGLRDFISLLGELRRTLPSLNRSNFLTGIEDFAGVKDVFWLAPDGREMELEDWHDPERLVVGMEFSGDNPVCARLLLLANASQVDISFRLWPGLPAGPWDPVLNTGEPRGIPPAGAALLSKAGTFILPSRSLVLFRHHPAAGQS